MTQTQEVSTPVSSNASVVSLLSGDMNGDGFADVFQEYLGQSSVSDVVSFGPAFDTASEQTHPLGSAIVTACDFDSDGYTDLIASNVEIYRGGSNGPLDGSSPNPISVREGKVPVTCSWNTTGLGSASLILSSGSSQTFQLAIASSSVIPGAARCDGVLPSLPVGSAGAAASMLGGGQVTDIGDADGDGYDDLLVGDPLNNRSALFFGGCPIQRVIALAGGTEFGGTPNTGAAVAATGDVDGDGFPDFAVANVFGGIDDYCTGEVYLYRGGPSNNLESVPSVVLTDPDHTEPAGGCSEDGFGVSLD